MAKLIEKLFSPKYLLATNTVIGVGFFFAADALQQRLEHIYIDEKKEFEYDERRGKSMLYTGTGFGFAGHYWYKFLDTRFAGKSTNAIGKKLLCEMAIGPPLAGGFFISVGFLEGKTLQRSWNDFKDNLPYICAVDWLVYAPLQAINFYYLPPKFRFLYVGFLTLLYDVFLSYVLHRNDVSEKIKKKNVPVIKVAE